MPIHLLREKATREQVRDMLVEHSIMIKVVVDVRRHLLTGGGSMHYEGEQLLLEDGSEQDDLWGANWYPREQHIEFEALINLRPRLGQMKMIIQDPALREAVDRIVRHYLEGVEL
jgi:hypothetical protein